MSNSEAASWQRDIQAYLDPERMIPAAEQLEFMEQYTNAVGRTAASLGRKQVNTLSRAVEAHPDWRLVPTQLGKITERAVQLLPSPHTPLRDILDGHDQLRTPPDSNTNRSANAGNWHELWAAVPKIHQSDDIFVGEAARRDGKTPQLRDYGLRYKAPDGRLLSRSKYRASLVANGDAVAMRDGSIWTFPLLDVSRTHPDKHYKNGRHLFETLDYIVSPEARIGVQVLQALAGTPLHEDVVHVTNEVVSELRTNGSAKEVRGVVGVTRSVPGHFFRLSWWTNHAMPDWQISNGVSGLQPVEPRAK